MDTKRIMQTILVLVFGLLTLIAGCNFIKSLEGISQKQGIINASGRIEGDEYNSGSKITGKVEKIFVDLGDDVKKGQLLSYLYSKQLQSQFIQAKEEVRIWETKVYQSEVALANSQDHKIANIKQANANLHVNSSQLNKAQAAYRQNLLQLEQAKLQIKQSQLEQSQAIANMKKAEANLSFNEKEYSRYKNLFKEDAIPKTRYDSIENQYIAAKEEYTSARKQVEKAITSVESSRKGFNVALANVDIGSASINEGKSSVEAGKANVMIAELGRYDVSQKERDVKNSRNMLEQAKQKLISAKADLEDSKIYSPIDGTIVAKIVEPGEVIAGGTPVVTIINMDKLFLRVYLTTEKVGKLKVGNPVKIVPDSYNKESFEGVVYQICSKAEFTPKNVETKDQRAKLVFAVKIRIIDNKNRKLKPGMPSEAFIDTSKTITVPGNDTRAEKNKP